MRARSGNLKTGLVYEEGWEHKGEGVGRYRGESGGRVRPGMQGKQMLRADLTVPGNMQSR